MIRRDPLFKGATRPALLFGVPLVPLFIVASIILLLAVVSTIFLAALLIPLIVIMRIVTQADDQQFRLLGLKLWCRGLPHYNFNRHFWQASTYSPFTFKKRN